MSMDEEKLKTLKGIYINTTAILLLNCVIVGIMLTKFLL